MSTPVSREDLKKKISRFPQRSGVYLMKDKSGKVIYVGKAKNLRNRVRSYFSTGDGRPQIEYLVERIQEIDHIVTETEQQAFILERDLITKYHPRYNIQLKDDKSYLSIRIHTGEEWPRLTLVRRIEEDGARYFGPYTSGYELRSLLDLINRVIPLRTCSNTVFRNRQRPCLEHQIKRCCAPCCLPVDEADYQHAVSQAIAILEGKTEDLEKELSLQMDQASTDLRFEEAALLRDRMALLQRFRTGTELISSHGENRDVFALYREERLASLSILLVRNGRVSDSENFLFSDLAVDNEEILEAALEQFYRPGREIPEEILLPLEIQNEKFLQNLLRERSGHTIKLHAPKRGLKYRLLGLAELNAREHFITGYDNDQRYQEIAHGMMQQFQLRQAPRRVECVDISNLQGSDIVGALVSFFDGKPNRDNYRKYKISQQGKPDDFHSIYEVVERRLRKGLEQDDLPDLLVIDGGVGQLKMALAARDECHADIEIIALAKLRSEKRERSRKREKKPERVYIPENDTPIPLDLASEVTQFLQRLRDETHRFAITFHRSTRKRRVFLSVLDEIPGIGPERKARLLKAFGSPERMKEQTVAELARVGRMPAPIAENLKKWLKK